MSIANLHNTLTAFINKRWGGRTGLQKILANVGWLSFERAARMGIGLVIGVLVARYLGPQQFGVLNYASALVLIFGVIASLGLDSIVVKKLVDGSIPPNAILGTTFVLKLAGGVIALLAVVGIGYILRSDDQLTIQIIAILGTGMVFRAADSIDFLFQSKVESKYTVYAKLTAFVVFALVKLLMLWLGMPLQAFAIAITAEIILSAIFLIVVYVQQGYKITAWQWSSSAAIQLLQLSWPLIFSSIFVIVNMQVDKIFLAEMKDVVDVGIYSASSKIASIWYIFPVLVGSSVFPNLVSTKEKSYSQYLTKLQYIYTMMTRAALALAILTSILSTVIISFLYGNQYLPAARMLSVHIWSAVFVFHVSLRNRSFIIDDMSNHVMIYSLITVACNIAFNYLLIPPYGGIGAAYASLISWCITALVLPVFHKKSRQSMIMFVRSFSIAT